MSIQPRLTLSHSQAPEPWDPLESAQDGWGLDRLPSPHFLTLVQNLTDMLPTLLLLIPCPFSVSRKVDRDSRLAFDSSLVLSRSPPPHHSEMIMVRTFKPQIRPLLPAPVPPLLSAWLWSSQTPASAAWLCYLHSQGERAGNGFMASCKSLLQIQAFL